jgi:hypothetical protein
MENLTSNNPQDINNLNIQNKPSSATKFLLVITLIVIFLISLFVLNYFNIVSVSSFFPNQLGWLPHKTMSEAIGEDNFYSSSNVPTVTLQPIQQVTTEVALDVLAESLLVILVPSFVPDRLDLSVSPIEIEENGFTVEWHDKQATVSASFAIAANSNDLSYIQLSVINPQDIEISSTDRAEVIISQFFPNMSKADWNCKINLCNSFWTDSDGTKKGFSISGQLDIGNNKKAFVATYCEYKKNTPLHELNNNSCFN